MTRAGFTLIEVMLGIVIAGLAASIAMAVFVGALDSIDAMAARARQQKAHAARWVWLAESLLAATPDSEFGFRASRDSMSFRSTVRAPQGWSERTRVRIALAGHELRLHADIRGDLVLADSVEEAAFDYLAEYGAESPWLGAWDSYTRPPLAVRLRLRRIGASTDTILFFIGDRR